MVVLKMNSVLSVTSHTGPYNNVWLHLLEMFRIGKSKDRQATTKLVR